MTWLEELRRVRQDDGRNLIGASFRGAPFFVFSDSLTTGRRTVTHEFPFRDDPDIEDLGRRARTFPIVGYVLGDDYLAKRNALTSALEEFGPGELIHPQYAATLRAIPDTVEARHSRDEGGISRFSILFKEAPEGVVAPVVVEDLAGAVETVALLALQTVVADLGNTYDVAGQPGFATASLSDDVSAIATSLGVLLAPVVTGVRELHDDVETAVQELAALDVAVAAVVDDAIQLARAPTILFERLDAVLASIGETILVAPRRVFTALLGVYDTPEQPVAEPNTPTRVQEAANQVALGGALREWSLLSAAGVIVQVDYLSLNDAVSDRTEMLDRLDVQILIATDAVYPHLVDARVATSRAVPGDAQLARVITVERRLAIPALLLSYELYGTVDREAEILAQNPTVQHPGFVLGELSVLSG